MSQTAMYIGCLIQCSSTIVAAVPVVFAVIKVCLSNLYFPFQSIIEALE
jgi:hypothetical protein